MIRLDIKFNKFNLKAIADGFKKLENCPKFLFLKWIDLYGNPLCNELFNENNETKLKKLDECHLLYKAAVF